MYKWAATPRWRDGLPSPPDIMGAINNGQPIKQIYCGGGCSYSPSTSRSGNYLGWEPIKVYMGHK
jgi:hypothetical protein